MIFIAWHLGLGDAIACAAIVAKLAKDEWVTVPCWSRNEASVKSIFVNYPRVNVMVVENDSLLKPGSILPHYYKHILRLGYYNPEIPQLPDEDFVQWFYRQAGMDISEKEKYCPIKEVAKRFPYNKTFEEDLIFIHSDQGRDFNVSIPNYLEYLRSKKYKYMYPVYDQEKSILRYSGRLTESTEIHCFDSSFLHLTEALNVTGKKFYHKYARPNSTDFKYLKGWEVIQ